MKKLIFLLFIITFTQCTKEPFEPIDIFEEEMVAVDSLGNLVEDGSHVMLPVEEICNGLELIANKERVLDLPGGFQLKGTLWANTNNGITTISSGDFTLENNRLEGYGTMLMPELGMFKDQWDIADLFGANLSYGAGSSFRSDDEELPLVDEDCYFRFNIDPLADFLPGVIGGPVMIGNTMLNFKDLYIQPNAPAILFRGDIYQFSSDNKPTAVADNASKFKKFKAKAGKLSPKWSISDVHIGLAGEAHFPFRPNTFSDELEEIVGGTGFKPFQGHLYLKGTIPVKKYPLDVTGEAVVQSDQSPSGPMDLFLNGFDNSTYRMGINGKVEFGHALLDFLPLDLRVELGQATVQLNADAEELFLRMAGEYDTGRLYDELLGPELVKFLPLTSQAGKLYLSVGDDLSEWEFYIQNEMNINIPGFGEQTLQEAMLHITPEGIWATGATVLPFGIGKVQIEGKLERDGTFLMRGKANARLDFGKDVKLSSNIDISISNEGLFINGMLSLPGGISDFEVEGELSSKRIRLKGSQMTNINFGNAGRLKTDLSLEASSDKGVFVSGYLQTPLQVAMVEIEGEISKRGIGVRGLVKGRVDFGVTKLSTDLEVVANTWGGAYLDGMIDVPLGVIGGNIYARGEILGINKFYLDAGSEVKIDFGIASAKPMIEFGFSQSEISIAASAEFCVSKVCANVGLSFNPNWGEGTVEICGILPICGEKCL